MLKARGTKVSTSQISEFLQHVYEVSPWFPEGGSIDAAIWEKVGEDLCNHYKANGPAQVPIMTFSIWNLIKECLEPLYEGKHIKPISSAPPLAEVAISPPFSDEDVPFDLAEEAARYEKNKYPNDDVLLALVEKSLKNLNVSKSHDAAPLSPLQRAVQGAMQRGEDPLFCCPVIERPDPSNPQQGIREHQAIPFKVLKDLKAACAQYGATAPFTTALIDTIAGEALPPSDWKSIARACLNGGDYLMWKSDFYERAAEQAEENAAHNIPIGYDMLVGEGQYISLQDQLTYPAMAYPQINHLVLQAWRKLPSTQKTEGISKIRQGPDEPYADFVDLLLQAVGRLIVDGPTGTIIVKQLAFENANSACQVAIRPWGKKKEP